MVLMSAWMPAPPPESLPAMVKTRGGIGLDMDELRSGLSCFRSYWTFWCLAEQKSEPEGGFSSSSLLFGGGLEQGKDAVLSQNPLY